MHPSQKYRVTRGRQRSFQPLRKDLDEDGVPNPVFADRSPQYNGFRREDEADALLPPSALNRALLSAQAVSDLRWGAGSNLISPPGLMFNLGHAD